MKIRRIKYERWRAERGEFYYYVSSNGDIEMTTDIDCKCDNQYYEFGNYFKTRKEAQQAKNKILQVLKDFHKSKHKMKNKERVKRLHCNWHQVGSVTDRDGVGKNYDLYEVGRNGVTYITEYIPSNGMELWNFVIEYEDGEMKRVFNPNYIEYSTNQN